MKHNRSDYEVGYWAWQHDGPSAGGLAVQIAQAVKAYLVEHTARSIKTVHLSFRQYATAPERIGQIAVVLDHDIPAGMTYIEFQNVIIAQPEIHELELEQKDGDTR